MARARTCAGLAAGVRRLACCGCIPGPPHVRNVLAMELAERFAFYSLRAGLVLYLNEVLNLTEPQATLAYSLFNAVAYASPLLGGFVADVYLGKYATVIWFSLVYIAGALTFALTATFAQSLLGAFMGLLLIAIGTGGIKPLVGALGCEQLGEVVQEHERTRYWFVFYASINCGSIGSYFLTPLLRVRYGFGPAFLLSAAALVASFVVFVAGGRSYRKVEPTRVSAYALATRTCLAACSARRQRTDRRDRFLASGAAGSGAASLAIAAPGAGDVEGSGEGSAMERSPLMGSKTASGGQPAVPDGSHAMTAATAAVLPAGGRAWLAGSAAPATASNGDIRPLSPAASGGMKAGDGDNGALPDDDRPAGARAGGCCRFLEAAYPAVSKGEIASVRSVFNTLQILAFLPLFWLLFDSQGSTWVFQRKHMENCVGPPNSAARICMSPEQLGGFNPLFVLAVVPLCDVAMSLLRRTRLPALSPTPLRRLGVGMQATAAAFALTAVVQHLIDTSAPNSVNVLWQLPQFFVMSVGEVLVSATGQEWAFSQAPDSLRGTVMALYLLMVAIGNLLGGAIFQSATVVSQLVLLIILTVAMSVAGVLLSLVASRYEPILPPHGGGGSAGVTAGSGAGDKDNHAASAHGGGGGSEDGVSLLVELPTEHGQSEPLGASDDGHGDMRGAAR